MSTRRLVIAFLGAPVAWALHLAVSYFFVALGCGTGWRGAEPAVLLATVFSVALGAWAGWLGWRDWRQARGAHESLALDPPAAPEFLIVSGLILAALFCGAIIITGIAPLFLPMCAEGL